MELPIKIQEEIDRKASELCIEGYIAIEKELTDIATLAIQERDKEIRGAIDYLPRYGRLIHPSEADSITLDDIYALLSPTQSQPEQPNQWTLKEIGRMSSIGGFVVLS